MPAPKAVDARWYVIRVVSGTEEAVKASLVQRRVSFGLEKFILESFVPMQDVIATGSTGKKIKRRKNVFPGYILVRMVVTNESWYVVRNTPNVTGFLGAGTVPVPVSDEELARIRGMVEDRPTEHTTSIKLGDIATVVKGSFSGSEGVITEINEKKGTLRLAVNIFGRDTSVELEFAQVRTK